MLEVVAEREVAQHLKEGAVAGGLADILDIAGADALLAGGDAASRRDLLTRKIRLQRRHARVDQQQAVVVVRHQAEALHDKMTLALKEIQIHSAELIHSVLLCNHVSNLF